MSTTRIGRARPSGRPRRARCWSTYVVAHQADGPVAAAAHDGDDDARRRRPVAGPDPAHLPRRLPVGGRRGRGQPRARPRHRRAHGAHGQPPGGRRARSRRSAALVFGIALGALAVVELSLAVNPLAAALSLSGFLGYTLVYTVWLKRRTPQNIVIGGAAGAVPPLVGWAAVTGGLDGTAIYLFAIVFFWTPPHFWALSLLMKDEYAKVGVPMLPVVRGERETRRQILLYTLLLYAVTQLPFCAGGFGVDLPRLPRSSSAAPSSPARSCSSGAPTGARRCACTCSRSPTSRCCSPRWWPTSTSRLPSAHGSQPRPQERPHRPDRRPPSASSCSA